MDIFKFAAIAVTAALCALVLKKEVPALSAVLALAAGAVLMARAAGRSGRNFYSLLWTCAYGMFGAAGLYRGLAERDAFQQLLGTLWLILAAAWLVRAVQAFRRRRADKEAATDDNITGESDTQ